MDKKNCHTTTENNSEILESNSAAPAKNANFPMNSWAIIAITVTIPIMPFFPCFFRPETEKAKLFSQRKP